MILRSPELTAADCEFIAECCDWSQDVIYPSDVKVWIRRWLHRAEEKGFIAEEDGQPVGFLVMYYGPMVAEIHNIAVHPSLRGQGYASAMWRELKPMLIGQGLEQIMYRAVPGLIADLTGNKIGEKIGTEMGKTGQVLTLGRVTKDMVV